MYTQVKSPELDPYITQNGEVLTDWLGWCLAYVQTAFGAGWAGNTAWDSWTYRTQTAHEDRNLPSGVFVPIWFSHYGTYNGVYKNWGHVAIYKDGQVWSSPITHKPFADAYNSIADVERLYRATYVGWSEDIGGTQVVQLTEGEEMIANTDEAYWMYKMLRPNGGASQDELDMTAGKRSYASFLDGAKDEINSRDAALRAKDQTITDLQTALANEQAKPPKEVIKEVEKIVTQYVDRPVEVVRVVEPRWVVKLKEMINNLRKEKK